MMATKHNDGLTLVEMLVVLGIIAVLATIGIRVTMRMDTQSRENALGETFALLSSALEQFDDYGYTYAPTWGYANAGFGFPPDCDGFLVVHLQETLKATLGVDSVQITNHVKGASAEYVEYSGGEALYFFLSRVPPVAQVLKGLSPAMVTNQNGGGQPIEISINGGPPERFPRVIDPWGTTLRYDYYDVQATAGAPTSTPPTPIPATRRNFPVLTSAGPDRRFGTADDIDSSRGR